MAGLQVFVADCPRFQVEFPALYPLYSEMFVTINLKNTQTYQKGSSSLLELTQTPKHVALIRAPGKKYVSHVNILP